MLLIMLANFFIPVQAQELEFRKLGPLQGLSHSTVYDIVQDEKGFMWFGTREGLNRYDGYELKTYYENSSNSDGRGIKGDRIHSLLSSRNRFLIGTSKGLSAYNAETDTFTSHFGEKSIDEMVHVLLQGRDNLVLIGTSKGLYTLGQNDSLKKIMEGKSVKALSIFKKDVYWVALNKRVLLINDLGEIIKEYPIDLGKSKSGVSQTAHTMFRDSRNNTWLGTSRGLYFYDRSADAFVHHPLEGKQNLESKVVRAIAEDKDNNLWIGTENGLFLYNKINDDIQHYSHSLSENPHSLSDKSVYSIFVSDHGMGWIGTYFGGVNYTLSEGKGFRKLSPGNNENSLHGKAVSEIIRDEKGDLWIGTEDGGISILDQKKKYFRYLDASNGLNSNNIHSLLDDDSGSIWIGTFLGGINRYDKASGNFDYYKHTPGDPSSLSNNNVYSFLKDRTGTIWVGTQFGLNIYDRLNDEFRMFKTEFFRDKFIYDMLEDQKGDIWICTRFSGIFRYRPLKDTVEHFSRNTTNFQMSSNQIVSATEDSRGNIWFGTLNGGMLKWDSDKQFFTSITEAEGLPNNNVYGIVESQQGNIWLTSNEGLTLFRSSNNSVTHFTSQDGLSTNQFNFRSAYKDGEGYIYFGSVKGLTFFHPDSLNANLPNPSLQFTGFQLFNKEVSISDRGILEQEINTVDSLVLKHHQNVITFEFAALNFEKGNKYAYYLEGFDESWNHIGNKRTATYTNLSPGEYVLKVQTLPLDQKNEREIHLTVLPPFWKTSWAYAGYFFLGVLALFAFWKFQRFVHHQKLAVRVEKLEKEKIKALNSHKLNFFTFISHEFKTPLTLILASIEEHFRKNIGQSSRSTELIAVKKSAGRLQHLIHQLMEFRKTETDLSKLDLKKGDIILFLKDTFEPFSLLFDDKRITYSCKTDISEYKCFFDPDKLEMIVTNLISNAIKNTPTEGSVNLLVSISPELNRKNQSELEVMVQDSGCGMSADEIEEIFNPFFKIGSNKGSDWQRNSGIGLALVRNLANLLEGKIEIKSTKGEGSTISVRIPLTLKISKDEETVPVVVGNKDFSIDPDILLDEPQTAEQQETENTIRDLSILIVEDKREIRKFLGDHFSSRFRIISAKNGVAALQKLEKYVPDIIISDLVMPEMDGIILCKKIRKNPQTKYIPFLLLTGKTEQSHKMEALRVGATAFLQKPFSVTELDLIVKNLLETNRSRSKRFSAEDIVKNKTSYSRSNQNEEFLKKISDLVHENYSNPSFSIEYLADKMSMSRSSLHLKMKKLTGASASEFVKRIRLQEAAELIKQGKTVSEAAYNTGYNDPNYFSRVFKKEFKVSPTKYREKVA